MLPHTSKQIYSEEGTITLNPDSVTVTGEFVEIRTLASTTFTTLVDAVERPATDFGGTGAKIAQAQTYPAGSIIRGRFTQIRLATGLARVTLASRQA